MGTHPLWRRFKAYQFHNSSLGLSLDISRMNFSRAFLGKMEPAIQEAFRKMDDLEAGNEANPDEKRMVGHYWLRDPARAPEKYPHIRKEIEETLTKVKSFASQVHSGAISAPGGAKFANILVIGIGGSALGPQLVAHALGKPGDPMKPFFFDNTDPDGIDGVLATIGGRDELDRTICIVISKGGTTPETRNGMLEARAAYERVGLDFARHAVAITMADSRLDQIARNETWLDRFPMWDWVGGRTSELSAVGLLPAALQGLDIDGLLAGARAMDVVTRTHETQENPAALLALMWYYAGRGKGAKDMVVLPYKDRLGLFSRYLQQLIMESLGKEKDLDGKIVHQGISVYGNKGSTDQHAYVQQLRDGLSNFFVTFIEVLKDRDGSSIEVEPGVTSGDYLSGFHQGTRRALHENGRESITLTIDEVNAERLGELIALYERAVGLYAWLININAYNQPGVQAGKKAADAVLALQNRIIGHLRENRGHRYTAEKLAKALGVPEETETVFKILRHLAANSDHGIHCEAKGDPFKDRYYA